MRPVFCAFVCSLLFASATAKATLITGTSEGSFANVSNCSGASCRISNGTDGPATVLEWGFASNSAGSTLVARDRAWNVALGANDVVLAELVWTNRATAASITPDKLGVQYTLNIDFSKPNVAKDSEAFSFTIINTDNPAGDYLLGLTLADLSNLSFALNGVAVSDMKYQLAAGSYGSLNGNYWYNPENMSSKLYITADFTADQVRQANSALAAQVPEPGSLALLAAGMLAAPLLRRRKRA